MSNNMSNESFDQADVIRQFGGDPIADKPFWDACREGRFLLHTCGICGKAYWPASRCLKHGDDAMSWKDSKGQGTLYTYTVLHKAYTAAMKDKVPYVVGVIQLDEGPFFHSNVFGCAVDAVQVGMKVQARMERHETGLTVPIFYPL
jgi:uncharacterized OB-fold protein